MKSSKQPFSVKVSPDWEAFLCCLRREGTPERVHFIELLIDEEIKETIAERFDLVANLDPAGTFYIQKTRNPTPAISRL